jgi:hypothetical protein
MLFFDMNVPMMVLDNLKKGWKVTFFKNLPQNKINGQKPYPRTIVIDLVSSSTCSTSKILCTNVFVQFSSNISSKILELFLSIYFFIIHHFEIHL